ncbi:hypothetical protein V6Z11_A12G063600 [Gossypium hirsutum]
MGPNLKKRNKTNSSQLSHCANREDQTHNYPSKTQCASLNLARVESSSIGLPHGVVLRPLTLGAHTKKKERRKNQSFPPFNIQPINGLPK